MDIRTTPNPLIRWAGRRLATLNARHPGDHNAHFHRWILRSLPPGAARVLDVGCGRGDLVRALAEVPVQVDGIDPDRQMAYLAAHRTRGLQAATIRRRTFAEHAAEELARHPGGAYDAITMIASLHHMDLATALEQARDLLRPGGRLLVVTLTAPRTATDTLWDIGNALTNPLIGFATHPRPVRDPVEGPMIPVRDPAWSYGELRAIAREVLPGAVLRRREGFRTTLRWQRPG
jgi:SAM-dependent methyltransferase